MLVSTAFRLWRARAMQLFLERALGAPSDVTLFLGDRVREWIPYVRIETQALWAAEPPSRKALALLRGRWRPSEAIIQTQAREAYSHFCFGGEADCFASSSLRFWFATLNSVVRFRAAS